MHVFHPRKKEKFYKKKKILTSLLSSLFFKKLIKKEDWPINTTIRQYVVTISKLTTAELVIH